MSTGWTKNRVSEPINVHINKLEIMQSLYFSGRHLRITATTNCSFARIHAAIVFRYLYKSSHKI